MEKEKIHFRTNVTYDDPEHVRDIVASTGFFYDFEIPVAVELVQDYLDQGEDSGYHFIFAEYEGRTVSYSCFGPIACTEGGFDLFWIATHLDFRGTGIGKLLLEETHRAIREMGGRYVIAETSMMDKYLPTRLFYEKNHYDNEGVIRDFYKPGDSKVIYVKRL
ncbi:MAG TPA: GNAT family N-acetyltransferase [Bacteroidales bacterium]|nr:GNAT family N-acetyltransferase [Bacteroidales bacterium]